MHLQLVPLQLLSWARSGAAAVGLSTAASGRRGAREYFVRRPMRLLCALAVFWSLAGVAAAAPADWFRSLPPLAQKAIQANLVLTGDYTGLIDGVFGPATEQAISNFQVRAGDAPNGVLTNLQIAQLRSAAGAVVAGLGMSRVTDARTGLSIFLPITLLTEQTQAETGTTYATKDGLLFVTTASPTPNGAGLADVLRTFQAIHDGTHVTYSKMAGSFLVVTGTGAEWSYYARVNVEGNRLVGYVVYWARQYQDVGTLTAIFAASPDAPQAPLPLTVAIPSAAPVAPLPPHADDERIGAFVLPADDLATIMLDGDIAEGAPLDFLRALRTRPSARTISLNSRGGLVSPALLVAHEVHSRGLVTEIVPGSGCYSACAYIFFAGIERVDSGSLGVHQIYGDKVTVTDAQMSLSDVLDELRDFDVSEGVISVMLRTPPDQIHVFSDAEIATLSINKLAPVTVASQTPHSPTSDTKSDQRPPSDVSAGATAPNPAGVASSESLLLEASDDGTTGAVPFVGTVDWSKGSDETGQPTLIGEANIPARNLHVDVLIRKNSNANLPASHLMEINFTVSDSFIGGSIAGLPGVLLKNEELVQGAPLVGASARVVGNSFLFALSAAPEDSTANVNLLTSRKWMDLALIYASGKRAIITLEKDDKAQRLFEDVFAAWSKAADITEAGRNAAAKEAAEAAGRAAADAAARAAAVAAAAAAANRDLGM